MIHNFSEMSLKLKTLNLELYNLKNFLKNHWKKNLCKLWSHL